MAFVRARIETIFLNNCNSAQESDTIRSYKVSNTSKKDDKGVGMIELIEQQESKNVVSMASIKVIGVGGAGGNTVNSILPTCHESIEFIVANTDAQALEQSCADKKIQLGVKSTRGLGTGADPELGKRAAEEDIDKIIEAIADVDIVFLTAGMGGGTGSGALPVIAHALKEKGILSIAIVTKPFIFEGKKRQRIAELAIQTLEKEVDTLLVIPNQKLLETVDQHVSMIDAFTMINDLLGQSVRGISDIITKAGYINVDFADVRNIMKSQGLAVMGTARASGKQRAQDAALRAISCPLLENMSIAGAQSVLLNITGGPSLGLQEIGDAARIIYEQVDENAQIIIGSVIDSSMQDDVSVTIIATGFSCRVPEATLVAAQNERNERVHTPTTPQAHAPCCNHTDNYAAVAQYNEYDIKQSSFDKVNDKRIVKASYEQHEKIQPGMNDASSPQLQQQQPHVTLDEMDEDAQIRALFAADEQRAKSKQEEASIDLDIPTFLRQESPSRKMP